MMGLTKWTPTTDPMTLRRAGKFVEEGGEALAVVAVTDDALARPLERRVGPRPASRGLWSAQIDEALRSYVPARADAISADQRASLYRLADEAVRSALARGVSYEAVRLLLQLRALTRPDRELFGHRAIVEQCARRMAEQLIGGGCERPNARLSGPQRP